MNDPHVVALNYRIKHGRYDVFEDAETLEVETEKFQMVVKNNMARFQFKNHIHFASENEARKALESYIRSWTVNACLDLGPDAFQLVFDRPDVVDRNPSPRDDIGNEVGLSLSARAGSPTASFRLTISHSKYPSPPTYGMLVDPDVETMFDRYMNYKRNHEPLAGMPYFCLTVIESLFRPDDRRSSGQFHNPSQARKNASECLGIGLEKLKKIGELSSTKGGSNARKAGGLDKEITQEERQFLEDGIKLIIRRLAKIR